MTYLDFEVNCLELNRGKVGLNSENRGVNCVDCVHSQVQYSQIDDSPNLRGLGNKMSKCYLSVHQWVLYKVLDR